MKKLISLISFLFVSLPTFAIWQLDNEQSIVNFVSVKKANIAEAHHFNLLKGVIKTNGSAEVTIALASVDSGIEIRDTRLKEMLFKTDVFPSAMITANVSNKFIDELTVDESVELMLQGRVELNGQKKSVQIPTWVTKVSETKLMVISIKPVIINAKDFGLEEGVQQLKEIASLPSISNAVPVSFVLTFIRGK